MATNMGKHGSLLGPRSSSMPKKNNLHAWRQAAPDAILTPARLSFPLGVAPLSLLLLTKDVSFSGDAVKLKAALAFVVRFPPPKGLS